MGIGSCASQSAVDDRGTEILTATPRMKHTRQTFSWTLKWKHAITMIAVIPAAIKPWLH
jgi:hypothetical protein